jgi:hypothetical protein
MRANPAEFELVAPRTLPAVLSLLAQEPGAWLPIAGGTDVMVQYSAGKLPARRLVSIWNLSELRSMEVLPDEIRIGAGCTYTNLREHNVMNREFALLSSAASWTGGIATKTAEPSAAISSTLRRPRIRSPRFWSTKPNCFSSRLAVNVACLTRTFTPATARPASHPMSSFAPSA